MKIVTICSRDLRPDEWYYRPDVFLASCKRFGHEPVVLKEGYGGLGSKLRMLKTFLDTTPASSSRMIFCDSFDVIFQQDPMKCEFFMEQHPGPRMIFNAERHLFPMNAEVFEGHPLSETSYAYLNSGFIVGEVETFRKALDLMNVSQIPNDTQRADGSWMNPNDQEYWQRLFVAERKQLKMVLDTRAQLCQTLSSVLPEELDLSGPLIRNIETGETPIALHLNGRKEEWLPVILKHLKFE